MIHTTNNNNTNKVARSRLFASGIVLLVLASMPDLTLARYGSCGRSYHRYGYHPHNYNAHWGGGCWGGGWGGHCGRRRHYYNPFYYLMDAGLNSLTRQERRNSISNTRRRLSVENNAENPLRYRLEDHGTSGLELTVEALGFVKAHEIDLDIQSTTDGEHTLSVRGTPGVHYRRAAYNNPEISQSFLVHDDTIDVDGIQASLDSGILTISLPRKSRKRTRIVPSAFTTSTESSSSRGGDEILVFDARRQDVYGKEKQRSARKSFAVDKAPSSRKSTSNKSNSNKKKKNKPYPDDEDQDDDGLWISEAEDIW